jgi:hypothetical protein
MNQPLFPFYNLRQQEGVCISKFITFWIRKLLSWEFSRILIFFHSGSRIPDSWSNNNNKWARKNNQIVVLPFVVAINFTKVEKHLMFWTWTEQDLSHLTKNLSIFNPKFFLKFSELYRLDQDPDLRSGIRDPAETYPRSESAILITSAVGILFQAWIETQQYCKTSIFSLEAFYSTFFAQPQIHTKKTASQESKRWGVMQYLPIQYRQAGMQQQMKKVEPIM